MKTARLLFIALTFILLVTASASAKDLLWLKAEGGKYHPLDDPSKTILFFRGPIQAGEGPLPPSKKENGQVFLVMGDQNGDAVYNARRVGRLVPVSPE